MFENIKILLGKNWKLIIISVAIFSLNLVWGNFWVRLVNWILGLGLIGYIAFMGNQELDETIFNTVDIVMGRKNYGSKRHFPVSEKDK